MKEVRGVDQIRSERRKGEKKNVQGIRIYDASGGSVGGNNIVMTREENRKKTKSPSKKKMSKEGRKRVRSGWGSEQWKTKKKTERRVKHLHRGAQGKGGKGKKVEDLLTPIQIVAEMTRDKEKIRNGTGGGG